MQLTAAISSNDADIATNASGIAANVDRLDVHEGLVTTNIANIATNASGIAANVDRLDVHEGLVMQNMADIASNRSQINLNSAEIASLGEDVYSLRSGIAATLATAGMPMAPGAGWGVSFGVGSYDSEAAVAAGLTYAGDR